MSENELSGLQALMTKTEKKNYVMDYNSCLFATLRSDNTSPTIVYFVDFKARILVKKKELPIQAELKTE